MSETDALQSAVEDGSLESPHQDVSGGTRGPSDRGNDTDLVKECEELQALMVTVQNASEILDTEEPEWRTESQCKAALVRKRELRDRLARLVLLVATMRSTGIEGIIAKRGSLRAYLDTFGDLDPCVLPLLSSFFDDFDRFAVGLVVGQRHHLLNGVSRLPSRFSLSRMFIGTWRNGGH